MSMLGAAGRALGRGTLSAGGALLSMAPRAALYTAGATLGIGAAAATAATAAGYVGYRGLSALAGGKIMGSERIGLPLGMGFPLPQFTPGGARALIGTAMAGAGIAGATTGARRQWGVSQTGRAGMPEIERPDFMGATGSLALSSRTYGYDNTLGLGGVNVPSLAAGGAFAAGRRLVPRMADDLVVAALRGIGG